MISSRKRRRTARATQYTAEDLQGMYTGAMNGNDVTLSLTVPKRYEMLGWLVRAAVAARRASHASSTLTLWKAAAHTLDGPTERIEAHTVFPANSSYWLEN